MWLKTANPKFSGVISAFSAFVVGLNLFSSDLRADDKEKKENVDSGKGVSAFGTFLPLNRVNLGVAIPSFDDGVRTALVTAEKMMRVDEDYLELENMVIETFLPDGSTDSRVSLIKALFHMPTSTLVSKSRSKIHKKEPHFQIEGDRLVFDTQSQRGRMAGNVVMLIYDAKGINTEINTGEDEAPAEEEKSTD